MPDTRSNHNLIKICKRKYRNPIYLAREWRRALDEGKHASPAAIAHHFGVTRARVTQIMNLLQLSSEAIALVCSLGDPLSSPIVAERRLRPLLGLSAEQQKVQVEVMLSGEKVNGLVSDVG